MDICVHWELSEIFFFFFTGVGKASVDILFTVSYLRGGERAGVGDGGDELVSEREEEESVEKEEIKRATL